MRTKSFVVVKRFRYFGPLYPGERVREGKWIVEFKCVGSNCLYVRHDEEGKERFEEILGGADELYLYPTIYAGENAYYIMLKLNKDILIAPESETQIMSGIPISVMVVMKRRYVVKDMEKGREWVEERMHTIDYIPFTKIAYALYGSPERGILTRFYEAKIGSWVLIREVPLQIRLINSSTKVETVRKLIVPVMLPKVYYVPKSDKVFVSPLRVVIERGIATIYREEHKPPSTQYVEVPGTGRIPKWIAVHGL